MTDELSQNGWPASADPVEIGIAPLTVQGVAIGDGVRAGTVVTVFTRLLDALHTRVEPLENGHCWGYKYRPIGGSATLSNHASGTAVDVNAPSHPQGRRGTFTPTQVNQIHAIVAELNGAIRWGGDYVAPATVDEMHFEVNQDQATLAKTVATWEVPVTQLVDYSGGYPGAVNVKARRYGGALRYLRKEGTSRVKPITRVELDDYRAHGLDLVPIYEHVDPARARAGQAAGNHDAHWALQQLDTLKWNPPCVYFTVDYDAPVGDWDAIEKYFVGIAEVLGLGRVGYYGKYALLDRLASRNRATWYWQTYAWSAGHNQDTQSRHPAACLFQRLGTVSINGVDCDVNDVLKTNYGQESTQEDDMTPDQDTMLKIIYQQVVGATPDGGIPAPGQFGAWPPRQFTPEEVTRGLTLVDWTRYAANQQVADVDEAALAAELEARGIGGVTAAQVKEIVLGAFERAASDGTGTSTS